MREQRKRLVGVVTSDKMDKTVIVEVTTTKRHPVYGKVLRLRKKYQAHDEANECRIGDRVQIIESQPISRHKRFAVVSILERAK
ncbi:MAG: 30S ribosomal protein S17 [Chloroflexi bacterium]|nr:30S ribosomal protein S17 [Chloroflexota bacterium]MBK6710360.1 30S ribosomal protein S17 [Chloroflexota bacterium]MBK7180069.1 30S ribosomal protein S17 [Chloroflexota bacterium]MBK7917716.1 30S ribosomal protein S17 [Chloroflexota bacterium]MBK8934778.1 30S ribosomal protein S17 [Chloroflexota bacterium]